MLGLKFRALEHVTLLSLFAYRERVLDRWLERHVKHARKWFAGRDTVEERAVWVDLAVKVEGKLLPKLSPQDVRPYFRQQQLHVLIHGDGGVGKNDFGVSNRAMGNGGGERAAFTSTPDDSGFPGI